jgi:hypothetical protein
MCVACVLRFIPACRHPAVVYDAMHVYGHKRVCTCVVMRTCTHINAVRYAYTYIQSCVRTHIDSLYVQTPGRDM